MQHDLRLNLKKTEFMLTNFTKAGTIIVSNPKIELFKYLRSMLSANDELCYEITSHISATLVNTG